jgi:hypothetical protein
MFDVLGDAAGTAVRSAQAIHNEPMRRGSALSTLEAFSGSSDPRGFERMISASQGAVWAGVKRQGRISYRATRWWALAAPSASRRGAGVPPPLDR